VPRRSALDVAAARAQTLAAAVELASIIGLEGLTIGRLADELAMTKSGLVGRFGSKQALQLATLDHAAAIFRRAVYDPACAAPPGVARLRGICDAWIAYLGDPPFPGGCCLTTAVVEFDARTGPVHDAVVELAHRWRAVLEHQASLAVRRGELTAGTDPGDVAFTLNALAVGANCDFQLTHERRPLERARRAMDVVLAG
jgi:AcrR family transcriptional regulator